MEDIHIFMILLTTMVLLMVQIGELIQCGKTHPSSLPIKRCWLYLTK